MKKAFISIIFITSIGVFEGLSSVEAYSQYEYPYLATYFCAPEKEYSFAVTPYVSQCSCPANTTYQSLDTQSLYGVNRFICKSNVVAPSVYCSDGTVVYNGGTCPHQNNCYSYHYGSCGSTYYPQPAAQVIPLTQLCPDGSVISLYSQCPAAYSSCGNGAPVWNGYSYSNYCNSNYYQPYNSTNYFIPSWQGNGPYIYNSYPTLYSW